MSICQIIDKELQKILGFELDLQNLNPQKYDVYSKDILTQIERLDLLQKIVNLKSESLTKVDAFLKEQNIDNEVIELTDLFTCRPQDISESSTMYLGDLVYREYQKINPSATRLPEKLKIILGNIDSLLTSVESVNLEYVEGHADFFHCEKLISASIAYVGNYANFEQCSKLKTSYLGYAGYWVDFSRCTCLESIRSGDIRLCDNLYCNNSSELRNISVGNITGHFDLRDCYHTTLESVSSIYGQSKRVKVGLQLKIGNSGLERYSDQEILTIFEVDPENIIRD